MNVENALRFVAREAERCREHDEHEALCLLLPALTRALDLRPMTGNEVEQFRRELKEILEHDFRFDPEPTRVGC